MKKLEQLKKQASKINNEIYAIEQAEIDKIQIPKIKRMVGWCMESNYDNKKEKTYRKILEWVENKEFGVSFILEEICLNKEGEVSIRITSEHPYTNKEWWKAEIPLYGIKKISNESYEQEKTKLLNEMVSRNLLRNFLKKSR